MPRFFFDIEDIEIRQDKEDPNWKGLNAARLAAVRLSRRTAEGCA